MHCFRFPNFYINTRGGIGCPRLVGVPATHLRLPASRIPYRAIFKLGMMMWIMDPICDETLSEKMICRDGILRSAFTKMLWAAAKTSQRTMYFTCPNEAGYHHSSIL